MKKNIILLILLMFIFSACGDSEDLIIVNDSSQNLKKIELNFNDSKDNMKYVALNAGSQVGIDFPDDFSEGHINIIYYNESGEKFESLLTGYYSKGYPTIHARIT